MLYTCCVHISPSECYTSSQRIMLISFRCLRYPGEDGFLAWAALGGSPETSFIHCLQNKMACFYPRWFSLLLFLVSGSVKTISQVMLFPVFLHRNDISCASVPRWQAECGQGTASSPASPKGKCWASAVGCVLPAKGVPRTRQSAPLRFQPSEPRSAFGHHCGMAPPAFRLALPCQRGPWPAGRSRRSSARSEGAERARSDGEQRSPVLWSPSFPYNLTTSVSVHPSERERRSTLKNLYQVIVVTIFKE